MKLSTKGRYGTQVMLDLALHHGKGRVLLKDIARRQEISENYLEHLMPPLKAAKLISSSRGAHGGYILTNPPHKIKLIDIIQALEGSLAPAECVNTPRVCSRSKFCVTRDVWTEMKAAIDGVLESTTLQDLVERQKEKDGQKTSMYHI